MTVVLHAAADKYVEGGLASAFGQHEGRSWRCWNWKVGVGAVSWAGGWGCIESSVPPAVVRQDSEEREGPGQG